MQGEGVAARLHKEAAALMAAGSASMAGAEAFAADLLRLGPSPEGHSSHLHYLRSLLTSAFGVREQEGGCVGGRRFCCMLWGCLDMGCICLCRPGLWQCRSVTHSMRWWS